MTPSSVRERLDREQRHQQEPALSHRSVSSLVVPAVPTSSVRQREEMSRIAVEEEKLTLLDPLRSTRGRPVEAPHVVASVRDRINQQRFQRETAAAPTLNAVAEDWAEANRQSEQRLARMRAQREAQQAEINRINAERTEYNTKIVPINLMLDSAPGGSATPQERKKVLEAAQRKYSGVPTPQQALNILLVLRGAIGGI